MAISHALPLPQRALKQNKHKCSTNDTGTMRDACSTRWSKVRAVLIRYLIESAGLGVAPGTLGATNGYAMMHALGVSSRSTSNARAAKPPKPSYGSSNIYNEDKPMILMIGDARY